MRILLSGTSGFIGNYLYRFFLSKGYTVIPLLRKPGAKGIYFPFDSEMPEAKVLENFDAIFHLGGENLFKGYWTQSKKRRLFSSRVLSTQILSNAIKTLKNPPKVFISASALGYYGNIDIPATENTEPGKDFLAHLCQKWEEAAKIEKIRCVQLRLGIVLGKNGGMLQTILPSAKRGLAAILGSGKQQISWIHIQDVAQICDYILHNDLSGPLNLCTNNPITQKEFIKILCQILRRPVFLKIPRFFLKILFGEMADSVLLANFVAKPEKLLHHGYDFSYSNLKEALNQALT